jgi:hypothetical protein
MLDLRFHHFGLAAREPHRAATFVHASGYEVGPPVRDPLQRVELRWCVKPDAPAIEIVSPAGESGPLGAVLADNPTSFYHLCYEIEGKAEQVVASLRDKGMRVITVVAPVPAVLFAGRSVSFHMVQGFGLVELLEVRVRVPAGG